MTEQATDPNTPGTNQVVIYPTSAGGVSIKRDDGTVLTLAGTGVLTVPATGTAATYTSGTWVPVVKFGATTVAGVIINSATYAIVGNMLFFQTDVVLTAKNGTGSATIAGLPVAAHSVGLWPAAIGYYGPMAGGVSTLLAYVTNSTSVITLLKSAAGTASVVLADTDFSTTTEIVISGFYRIA
jgi:hypothetical protein